VVIAAGAAVKLILHISVITLVIGKQLLLPLEIHTLNTYSKMQQSSIFEIKDTYANPAPLGLAGFGLTTVLLNIHNAGLFPLDMMIVAMGIFYGGLAQIVVGIMEFKKNNTFGTTAFTSYGFFWISLVFIWLAPETGLIGKPSAVSMAFYLTMWGIFSAFLFAATFKMAVAMR
jgi:uncharacterized protein